MLGRLRTASLITALVAVALASASAGQSPGPPGGTVPSDPSGGTTPGGPSGAPPGLDVAIAVKQRHADELLDLPGVAGVGVGLNPAGKPVIRVYTEKRDAAVVPSSLEGVAVESAVTGIIQARAPTDRFPRPVPIGVSSGLDGVATGTLGARVTNGTNVYVLSNNHVLAGINSASIGDPIIQPGNVDGGSDPADRIATLAAYQTIDFNGGNNTMDAAIALTSTANVSTATPADGYGTPSNVTAQASIGQAVQKYGRTTGLQLGTVAATNVSVDVCYLLLFEFCLQEARFVGQISVSPGPFSAPGDSGSLIVTQGGNQPVALLFAGGDGLTIGTPIDLVLQRFGVTIDGSPPGDGPPGAPIGLSALPGDGLVSLSWTAPSFDGNSPITGYRVYRGTSPAGETFLQSVGPGTTTFEDTSVTNGTTYYYKVSAENALGEGPLSSERSATPGPVTPPTEPLPTLDSFDRGDENPLSDGGNWSNGILNSGESGLVVSGNALACTRTTTCSAWRSNRQYGPDVEAWATFTTMPGNGNGLRLYARLQQPGSATADGYVLRAVQQSGSDQILVDRLDNGAFVNLMTLSQELAVGDTILLRASGPLLEAWRRDGSGWSRLGTVADQTYSASSYVGVSLRGTTGRLDDFGGRTMGDVPPPPEAPGAPRSLSAQSGNGVVQLAWQPPDFDGNSPVLGYLVYRGTSPGGETFLQSTPGRSFSDTGVANGTTYYYEVAAVNAVNEGPRSNEASATPTDVFPPVEPLPTLDGFDRPNENPLSDGGRWANGILGSGESGLTVSANALACTTTSTCTAWRQNALYGPDSEAWARITTLPGNGNGLRLYVRIQQPGSSAVDGYVLRWAQQSGADQLLVDRLTNGVFANLLTLSPEIALGDTLLLRAAGSTLEVWRKNGGGWTRLGFVGDTVYAGAGYVGVGLRAKTGRLDDFGARVASPTVPGVPTSLSAAAGNGSVSLSWTAPVFDGGAALSYNVHRGTSPGGETLLQSAGASTTFTDTTVTNGTTYYYKVSAVNGTGEGALSNEVSATPTGVVPPVEPLPTLDGFDRPDENPLSGGGSWANGIIGSGENGLKVTSNALACSRSTICSAWRQNAPFGPDAEAWVTVTTLPGNGNGLRLYVRLQQPGSSAADGYVLRWTQQSGADQLLLDRMTNNAFTNRLTLAPEIALGDTLLLRATGSTLEVWRRSGGVWSRLGFVTDSTYASAGLAGVALRGTTGRLDDFGARTRP